MYMPYALIAAQGFSVSSYFLITLFYIIIKVLYETHFQSNGRAVGQTRPRPGTYQMST